MIFYNDPIYYDNVIKNLQGHGGDPLNIKFSSPHPLQTGGTYVCPARVVECQGKSAKENIEMIVYTISFLTSEFFTDKENLVTDTAAADIFRDIVPCRQESNATRCKVYPGYLARISVEFFHHGLN